MGHPRGMTGGEEETADPSGLGMTGWGEGQPGRILLAGPDAGGEGADGGEAEALVELYGGAIFRGDGES
jgi:hypothetical protein